MKNKSLTILSPVYNEVENIDYFLKKMLPILVNLSSQYNLDVKLKILDNGSTDETVDGLTRRLNDSIVKFEIVSWIRNYGVMTSIYGGIIETDTDALVVIDFDLQDPPDLIGPMVERWLSGDSFVYGSRVRRFEKLPIKVLRKIFNTFANVLKINSGVPVESGLWLLDKNVVNDLIANPPTTKYLAGAVGKRKYKSSYINYIRDIRVHGESKFSMNRYFRYAAEALFSNPYRIARMSIFSSLLVLFFGGIIEIFLIACRYIFEIQIPNGLISVILLQVISFSGIFLALGVLGEYVAHIYSSVCRPAKTIAKLRIKN